MIDFYYARGSCSAAPHILLEEIGVPYTAHAVNFDIDEQRSSEFLKINPKGKVPVLCVDGKVITENVAIQYYLATSYPEKNLCPRDKLQHVQWLSLISWISNTVHPDARHISRPENYSDDPASHAAIRAKGKATLAKWLAEIDLNLETKTWMMGDQYTTADPYALMFMPTKNIGIPIQQFRNCAAWRRRMLERPAVRKILQLN